MSQDKRGISAAQLANLIEVTYKTAWGMLRHLCNGAAGCCVYALFGVVGFDDAHFGDPKAGSKRGRGTEKAKVLAALSLDKQEDPQYLKLSVTKNIKQAPVRKFAKTVIQTDAVILRDGSRSYIGALDGYTHEYKTHDPNAGMLHWLHIMIGNAKALILGTYHSLPRKYLQSRLDEFVLRFSRSTFNGLLTDWLLLAAAASSVAY